MAQEVDKGWERFRRSNRSIFDDQNRDSLTQGGLIFDDQVGAFSIDTNNFDRARLLQFGIEASTLASAKQIMQKYGHSEVDMDETVQIRKRGVLTLPSELREKYGIQEGDTFRLIDLDGIFVLTPMVSLLPELASEIEAMRLEAGVSIQELLEGLREQRERYHEERYGQGESG